MSNEKRRTRVRATAKRNSKPNVLARLGKLIKQKEEDLAIMGRFYDFLCRHPEGADILDDMGQLVSRGLYL